MGNAHCKCDKWQQSCDRWKLIPEAIIVIHCPPGNWLKRGTFMRKYGFCQFYCGHLSKKRYISGNSDLVYFGWMTWPWHSRWHIGSIQYGTYSRGWKSWEYEFWQSISFGFQILPPIHTLHTIVSFEGRLFHETKCYKSIDKNMLPQLTFFNSMENISPRWFTFWGLLLAYW